MPYVTNWGDPARRQEYEAFIEKEGPLLGFQSQNLWRAFCLRFDVEVGFDAFQSWTRRARAKVPDSPIPDLRNHVLRFDWKTFLVVSDLQVPYHDAELVKKALELADAYKADGIVNNGDHFDFAIISKFGPSIFGDRVSLADELKIGGEILAHMGKRKLIFVPGNHDNRLLLRLLEGQLAPDQAKSILALDDKVQFTGLSWVLNTAYEGEPIRVTHPGASSVIAGTVGADVSRNHDCHVIVAHDHLLCQRRSHSGRWTVTHSGMMADLNRLSYPFTTDNRRPRMNQGFVIVHPNSYGGPVQRLIDPRNVDWDLEFYIARKVASRR